MLRHSIDPNARYLGVQMIGNQARIYFEGDLSHTITTVFTMIGTGMDVPRDGEYIGTYLQPTGDYPGSAVYVWHVYKVPT